jgi:hypothetical protein
MNRAFGELGQVAGEAHVYDALPFTTSAAVVREQG